VTLAAVTGGELTLGMIRVELVLGTMPRKAAVSWQLAHSIVATAG